MIKILQSVVVVTMAIPLGVLAAEDRFFDSDGLRIRYIEQGSGEPVVLVHGFLGIIERWVELGLFANLAEDHRVIALDCRGYGKSAKPHDRSQYGRKMADDVAHLLDHLGIERAHILGYSMGGNIVLKMATL